MALQTTEESPASVRAIAAGLRDWIGRLGGVWIEGQVAQVSKRPGMRTAWLTLRDVEVDVSLSVVIDAAVLDAAGPVEGQRVIVFGRPEFYAPRGALQVRARSLTPVGRGRLLAELERVRALLTAEGLFAAERKRALPFLPRRVGLISGRASAAMHDVLVNARARWPAVEFDVREVAVQGVAAVTEVVAALTDLQRIDGVDVIVIARGGGSVEDLLPFSNEALVRAVAASRIPVVSAIGHEQDVPLVDLAADIRASTPTDAARRIVPDVTEQRAVLHGAITRGRRALRHRAVAEGHTVATARDRSRRAMHRSLTAARSDVHHLIARVRALSPAATLERGYAIVQDAAGSVVRDAREVAVDAELTIRVANGQFPARRT